MSSEQVKGKFDQLKGQIKKTWGKLTDDEVMLYEGEREKFFGKVEERYGIARDEAESKIRAMKESFSERKAS